MRIRFEAIAIALAAAAGAARAHDLTCEEKVDGKTAIVVRHFPATVHFDVTIVNTHPSDASTVASIVAPFGFKFHPMPPFSIPVGGSVKDVFDVRIETKKACEALAMGLPSHEFHFVHVKACHGHGEGEDECEDEKDDRGKGDDKHKGEPGHHEGDGDDDGHDHHVCTNGLCHEGAFLDGEFIARFDFGEAHCRARIVCGDEDEDEDKDEDKDKDNDDHEHDRDDHGHHDDEGHRAYSAR